MKTFIASFPLYNENPCFIYSMSKKAQTGLIFFLRENMQNSKKKRLFLHSIKQTDVE